MNKPFLDEVTTYFGDLYGDQVDFVKPRMAMYGRCRVNGMMFSSEFNSTDRGSIVKTTFVDDSNELVPYFGVVHFYFTVTVVMSKEAKAFKLAYVSWLKFRDAGKDKGSKLYRVLMDSRYQRDSVISPRRFLCRCVVVGATSVARPRRTTYLVSEVQ